jgi:pimeloyl-ACP methyl ester carboxylesterase
MGVTRRGVIGGSVVLGVAAVAGGYGLLANARVVPGRSLVDRALGRCDVDSPPEATPGPVVSTGFFSAQRARTVDCRIAYPPGYGAGANLPVCLFLHGLGGTAGDMQAWGLDRILAASVAAGTRPFALASVDGGDRFWHPRADGDNPLGMVLEELPGVLSRAGLRTDQLGLYGYSMGGHGALLALSERPALFAAVAVTAPAIWLSYDEALSTNSGAFDSAEDWQRWGDLRPRLASLAARPLRVDCGQSDSFEPNVRALLPSLPAGVQTRIDKGCHDTNFLRWTTPAQFAFLSAALTAAS